MPASRPAIADRTQPEHELGDASPHHRNSEERPHQKHNNDGDRATHDVLSPARNEPPCRVIFGRPPGPSRWLPFAGRARPSVCIPARFEARANPTRHSAPLGRDLVGAWADIGALQATEAAGIPAGREPVSQPRRRATPTNFCQDLELAIARAIVLVEHDSAPLVSDRICQEQRAQMPGRLVSGASLRSCPSHPPGYYGYIDLIIVK